MGATVSCLLMLQNISVQRKRLWNKKYPLSFGNIPGDFSANKMMKKGANGYVYKCSVDYNIIDTSNIINIHKYLLKYMK